MTVSKQLFKASKQHKPVLLKEVLDSLKPAQGDICVDATVGNGGHALEIAKRLGSEGRLVGLDRDSTALPYARETLRAHEKIVTLQQANYSSLRQTLLNLNIQKIQCILMDLGLSSRQIADPERGFSFLGKDPLDMRMEQDLRIPTAADFLRRATPDRIAKILRDFGEERYAKRIAKEIVRSRKAKRIQTTQDLADIVRKIVRRTPGMRIDPATRTFQGIRMAVNDELAHLSEGLEQGWEALDQGGRFCIISFPSLEDRIVKRKGQEWVRAEGGRLVFKGVLRPSEEEVRLNPRARSARMRAFIKLN
jgi:16S rRNA (cytosine1402-N4)-methyltransferase